jgi:hypothetical protein
MLLGGKIMFMRDKSKGLLAECTQPFFSYLDGNDSSAISAEYSSELVSNPEPLVSGTDLEHDNSKIYGGLKNIDGSSILSSRSYPLSKLSTSLASKTRESYHRIRDVALIYVPLLSLALYQWYQSLSRCELDMALCVSILKKQAPTLMLHVAKFALINFILLHVALRQNDQVARNTGIGIVAGTYLYIFFTSNGFSKEDHSQVNMVLAFVVFGLLNMLYATGYGLIRVWKRSKLLLLGLVLSLMALASLFYQLRVVSSCNHLYDSLHPDYVYSETGSECKWLRPKICWHYAIQGVYKPLFWGRSECNQYSTDLSLHRQKSGLTGIMSYPLSTKVEPEKRIYYTALQSSIISNLAESSQNEIDNGEKEVFIDFRNKPDGEVVIKLRDIRNSNPNHNLLTHDKDHMNVLHLFVDTVSRQRFFRKFKQTASLLKDYHFTNKKKTCL